MASIFVTVAFAALAAAFVTFALTMQRRRSARGPAAADADDGVIGSLYVG